MQFDITLFRYAEASVVFIIFHDSGVKKGIDVYNIGSRFENTRF
jgi:hypothetical protein